MARNKIKKDIARWRGYEGTIINDGAKEQIKRLERIHKFKIKKSKENT